MISHSAPIRRSTRRAAMDATSRIAEELAPLRRSTRSRSDNGITGIGGVTTRGRTMAMDATAGGEAVDLSIPAVRGMDVNRPPRGGGETKDTPIVLDDDDDSIEELGLKPAAVGVGVGVGVPTAAVAAAAERPPADFTCAICLDAPPCMSEVASIGGCTHLFCFDCIDRWAETENRCPCCKARFTTIDRVVALPPSPDETEEAAAGGGLAGGRRGKRKRELRGPSPTARGSRRGGNAFSESRVNSRVVEERSQPSASAFVVDAALIQHIVSSFINSQGEGLLGSNNEVSFGTSEDGRPQIRLMGENGRTMGIMEMYLAGAAHAQGGAGNNLSGARARLRISRAHRRSPVSASESGAERRSTINLVNGSAIRSAAADSTGGGASPSSAAGSVGNQQASSSLTSFFSSLVAGPPGGGARAGSSSVAGAATVAGSARGASGPSNRMTFRLVARPTAATRGASSVVDRDDPSRSTNRSASDADRDEGSGRGGSDEPIVIE
jgi:hypothetical protein